MTPDDALAALEKALGNGTDDALREAWHVLRDAAVSGDLPSTWGRLYGMEVAERLGTTPNLWNVKAHTGYAPSPDGRDGAGRSWWHPATIAAFASGEWTPNAQELARRPRTPQRAPGERPPTSGRGATVAAWRDFLAAHDVHVSGPVQRADLIGVARRAGLLRDEVA